MLDNKELNLEGLKKVAGGKFDKECDDWYYENHLTVKKRASEKGLRTDLDNLVLDLYKSKDIITLDIFKQKIKELGVDCDDLI